MISVFKHQSKEYLNGIPRTWQIFRNFLCWQLQMPPQSCHYHFTTSKGSAWQRWYFSSPQGMEQNPISQITLAFGKMSFHQPEMKNVVLDNSTVVPQKNICIILFFNLHKKWNAGQHAILKRSLIISFLSNSFAKNLLCVHTNLIVCCNSIMNYIPWVNYADLLVFIIWWLDVNQCVQWSNPVLIVGWTV